MKKNLLILFSVLLFTANLYGQPANDDCMDATAIGEVTDEAFTVVMATTDGPNHPNDCQSGGATPDSIYNDVWYTYTPTFTGIALWTMCGTADFDTKIAVYNSGATCPVTDGDLYACNEDSGTCANATSEVTFDVVMGETYLLRLGAYGDGSPGEEGTGTFSISETDPPPPAPDNNECSGAIAIMVGEGQAFNTTDATTTGPEHPTASCFAFGDDFVNDDVFFSFTPTTTATYEWSTCGLVFWDTRMAVYNAGATCPLEDGDLLNCNDDGLDEMGAPCTNFTSKMTFDAVAGETYIMRLGGYLAGDQGEGMFDLIEIIPPDPPSNDDCATAAEMASVVTVVEADNGDGLLMGTTADGTQDGLVPDCINNGELYDVWYSFNTGADTTITTRFSVQEPQTAAFILEFYTDCATPALDTATGGTIEESCFVYNPNDAGGTVFSDTVSGFQPDTDYLVRVSTVITFETPGAFWLQLVGEGVFISTDDEFTLDNVRLFPNPVQQSATIELVLEESAQTNYEVINALGEVVYERNEGNLSTGTHLLDVNMSGYSSGIYFIRVAADEKQRIMKFVKQ